MQQDFKKQKRNRNRNKNQSVFEKTKQRLFIVRFVDNRPFNPYRTTYTDSYCKKIK